VERCRPKNNKKVSVDSKEVFKAVLGIFKEGDDNLQNIYQDAPPESNEWRLCKKLTAGHQETYFANDPPTNKLVELGIVIDVDGYCQISSRLYKRQILKISFDQEYQTVVDSFPDNEQLLLHISCFQEILLNDRIRQLIFDRIEDLLRDESQTEEEITAKLPDYLDRLLKDEDLDLDMEEILAFIDYYNIKDGIEDRKAALSLLIKAFIGRFSESMAAE
jgi:hypothetical protein